MLNYQVQYIDDSEKWVDGTVIEMLPKHLSTYLSILGQRKVQTRLRRTEVAATYRFDGSSLKAKVQHDRRPREA